jgi:hypothetical protein
MTIALKNVRAGMLSILLWATYVQAATVTWTVTTTDSNTHTAVPVFPNNAQPSMATLISEAQAYLATHSSDTLILYFPKGKYLFEGNSSATIIGINIQNQNSGSLVLMGDGPTLTTLLFSGYEQDGIRINDSSNVSVRQMYLTRPGFVNAGNYDAQTMNSVYSTQGTVTSIDVTNGDIYFTLHTGFPDPVALANDNPSATSICTGLTRMPEMVLLGFNGSGANVLDPKLLPLKKILLNSNPTDDNPGAAVTFVSGTTYKAHLLLPQRYYPSKLTNVLQVGDWVALKVKVGADTVKFANTTNCGASDLILTRAASRAIAVLGSNDGFVIQRVLVDRPAPINGKGVCLSEPGGGIVIYSGPAAPTVIDCVIVGTADDGIAVVPYTPSSTSSPLPSGSVISGNTVRDTQRGLFLVASDSGLCFDNVFSRNGYGVITLQNLNTLLAADAPCGSDTAMPSWAVKNWQFADNLFFEPGVDPVIESMTEPNPLNAKHDNNMIAGNIIYDAPQRYPVIRIGYALNTEVEDNIIASFASTAEVNVDSNPINAVLALLAVDADGGTVTGLGNTYEQMPTPSTRTIASPSVPPGFGWSYDATTSFTSVTFTSEATNDGFVVESTAGADIGGTVFGQASGLNAIRIGDDANNKETRGFVSFNTSSLPSGATIVSATLRLKRRSVTGTDPFTKLGRCYVDIKGPDGSDGFSSNASLQSGDFQAQADQIRVTQMSDATSNGTWSEGKLTAGLNKLNKLGGHTQFRVYFELGDDGDSVSDLMGFYSAADSTSGNRPQLVVVYRP